MRAGTSALSCHAGSARPSNSNVIPSIGLQHGHVLFSQIRYIPLSLLDWLLSNTKPQICIRG